MLLLTGFRTLCMTKYTETGKHELRKKVLMNLKCLIY